ncbi:MAG TPA: hypothetical protein VFV10_08190 [Gammaproteobacteria bacterium]|nr:hypothetical protein [Gammaproteobacteria bacterium]
MATLGIGAAAKELTGFRLLPKVIYATKEVETYPIFSDPGATAPTVRGLPVKIIGVAVRNIGRRTATNVLVRFPQKSKIPYIGWIVHGGVGESKMDRETYQFDKLAPGEEVNFYIYTSDVRAKVVDSIEAFYDRGAAEHYPYRPEPASAGIYVPMWKVGAFFGLVALLLLSTDKQAKAFIARLLRERSTAPVAAATTKSAQARRARRKRR